MTRLTRDSAGQTQGRQFTFENGCGHHVERNGGLANGGAPQTVARTPGNGEGVQVGHTFTQAGGYIVRVIATDADGTASEEATHAVTITAVDVQADEDGRRVLVGGSTRSTSSTRRRCSTTCPWTCWWAGRGATGSSPTSTVARG